MTGNEIIDYCLDNRNLTEGELKNKLLSKLSESQPFDHQNDDVFKACGLIESTFVNKDESEKIVVSINMDTLLQFDKISEGVEYLEKHYNKREVSFLAMKFFVGMTMHNMKNDTLAMLMRMLGEM